MAEDGVTKQLLRKRRLTAGGASSRTAQRTPTRERRQVIPPDVSGQRWVTTFPSLDAFALQHFILDDRSAAEEEGRIFRAFGITTWVPLIWNEGVSGVFFDLRDAYNYWQQDYEQVNRAFDNLAVWIGALEGLQDPTDQLMDFDRPLRNTFRMRLTMASDPGIRLSKLRARLYTAVHQTDTYARATQPLVDRRETQRALRCQGCHIFGHEASTCNLRPRGNYSQYRRPSKNGRGAAARRS
ncbi:protein kinase-like protein, putative [Trypanosoma cruzi]|nr:protein kinase-like protein, putative [Trypanosoma cruzi]